MEHRPQPPEDFAGIAPTRVQTRTVGLAPDELETVNDQANRFAARADIEAYLSAVDPTGRISDEGTCLGDMVSPGTLSPQVLPAPRPSSAVEPRTVHAYCEPMLPFLPVEDLEPPEEMDLFPEPEVLYQPAPLAPLPLSSKIEDPILEYLREVSADFSPTVEPTALRMLPETSDPLVLPVVTSSPHLTRQTMGPEPTTLEQAHVNTTCMRYKPGKSNFSARVLSLKKRRTPLWAAALMGALIAVLLLTSSVFTVEVLASKLRSHAPAKLTTPVLPEPQPWVVPR